MTPAYPPPPTPSNLPFHPVAGIHTSTRICGATVSCTRQNDGTGSGAPARAAGTGGVGGANGPSCTSVAAVIVASGSLSEARLSHGCAAAAMCGADMQTSIPTIATAKIRVFIALLLISNDDTGWPILQWLPPGGVHQSSRLRRIRNAVRRLLRHLALRTDVSRQGHGAGDDVARQAAAVHAAAQHDEPLQRFLAGHTGWARLRGACTPARAGREQTRAIDGRVHDARGIS